MLSGRLGATTGATVCALGGVGLAVGLVLGLPAAAHAWTNTQPASAAAHVHVWPSGRALVRLTLEVEVRGGWLSEFEIAGLDPGSVLDPDKPPFLLRADGGKAAPRAELRPDGSLALSFAKADAPRRGRHMLGVTYFTQLALTETPAGARRMTFALPAWRVGLERVDLWVNAPAAARFLAPEESAVDGTASRRLFQRGGRTVLHLYRAGLPRTLAFGVELELPSPAASAEPAGAASPARSRRPIPYWLGLLALVLAWLKHRSVVARAVRRGGQPEDLVRLRPAFRAVLMLLSAAAGSLCYVRWPVLGLALLAATVALGLHRHIGRSPLRPAAGRRFERAYDLLGGASWFDATTPPGLALLGSAYALAALRVTVSSGLGAWLELLVLVTPLWLTGTRLHGARTGAAATSARASATTDPLRRDAGEDRRVRDRAA